MGSDPKVTDVQRQRAAENVAELSKKVGQIGVEAPSGARISIDGLPIESIADPVVVTSGTHVVTATVHGKERSVTVDCQPGTITKAKLLDEPAPAVNGSKEPGPSASSSTEDEGDTGKFWTTGRVVGAGLLGAGVVALGLGVLFQVESS